MDVGRAKSRAAHLDHGGRARADVYVARLNRGSPPKPSFGPAGRYPLVSPRFVIRGAGDTDVQLDGWIRAYCAAAAVFVLRKAGITSFAKRSRSASWTSSGVPSGVAQMTRSRPG